MFDGEVQRSTLVYSDTEEVWECVKRFGEVGEWMATLLEVCYVENAPCGPCDIGCTRRLVFRSNPLCATRTLLRERLTAHFSSPCKRYYTYDVLPYTPDEADRSPFPCPVHNLKVTVSVNPISKQYKSYLEFYATFAVDNAKDVPLVHHFLEEYFKLQLGFITDAAGSHHKGVPLPDALLKFHCASEFKPYEDDLSSLEALWLDAITSERAAQHRLQTAEESLAATEAILKTTVEQVAEQGNEGNSEGDKPLLCERCNERCAGETVAVEMIAAAAVPADGGEDADEGQGGEGAVVLPRSSTPHFEPGANMCVFPQSRNVPLRAGDIEALFTSLDTQHQGYLTPQQVHDFYLSIDVFETKETVGRVLRRYVKRVRGSPQGEGKVRERRKENDVSNHRFEYFIRLFPKS